MTMTSKLRILGLTLGAIAPLCAPAFAAQVGTASAVNPAATVNMRTITIGTSIAYAERIRTTSSGSVQVLFVDKTSMTVGPNSDVTIDEYVFDPKAGTGSLVATIGKGALRFVGGLISHNGNAEIKSPTAAIGIRGGVAIINGPNVYAGYGTSTVTTSGGTVTLGANEYTQALAGAAPTPPGPPPPGFVASQLALFQSNGGQTGGVAAGTASRANVAAASARATGSPNVSVVGSTTPTPAPSTASTAVQNTSRNTNLSQTIQTSVQNTVAQTIADTQPPIDLHPTVTLNGYLGGLDVIKQPGQTRSSSTSVLVGTTEVGLDAASSRVRGDFTAFFVDMFGQRSTGVQFAFGSLDPSTPRNSTYNDYNDFSAKAENATVIGVGGNQVPTSGSFVNVTRATAQQLAPNVTICQCDYTRWGTWSVQNNALTAESIIGTWVAGRPVQVTDMPATGSATYVGHVFANVANAGTSNDSQRLVAGSLTNNVNFAARTGAVSVTGLDGANYSGTVGIQGTYLGGSLAGDIGNRQMGMAGNFYRGVTNPVGEMGGTVSIQGTNYLGSGIFAAAIRR